jgi:hypothetical protein
MTSLNGIEVMAQHCQDTDRPQCKGNFMYRPVRWLCKRDEHEGLRKIVAYFAVFILTITIVGLFLVIPGVKEWKRQTKILDLENESTRKTHEVIKKRRKEERDAAQRQQEAHETALEATKSAHIDVMSRVRQNESLMIEEIKKHSSFDEACTLTDGLLVIKASNEHTTLAVRQNFLDCSKNSETINRAVFQEENNALMKEIGSHIKKTLYIEMFVLFKGKENNKDYYGEAYVISKQAPYGEAIETTCSSNSEIISQSEVKKIFEKILIRLECSPEWLEPLNLPQIKDIADQI